MLTITPTKISREQVVLQKSDFDELLLRANKIENVNVQNFPEEFSPQETQTMLQEVWNNDEDEKVWQQYL
jgi:hypothetical protein